MLSTMPRLPAVLALVCSLAACGGAAAPHGGEDASAHDAAVADADELDDAQVALDAPSSDAGADAGIEDAGELVDARAADAAVVDASSACPNDCPLVPAIEPTSCSDRWHTCRIMGCTTYCGEISAGSFPAPRGEFQTCTEVYQCDRGLGCLGDPLTCHRFCRLTEGDGDCPTLHCRSFSTLPAVDGSITLPPGIGICSS